MNEYQSNFPKKGMALSSNPIRQNHGGMMLPYFIYLFILIIENKKEKPLEAGSVIKMTDSDWKFLRF